MPKMQNITILGSTGTIGVQTLDVISRYPDRFSIFALTANSSVDSLFLQCQRFNPKYAVMLDRVAAASLEKKLKQARVFTEVLSEISGLEFVSSSAEVDIVMAAIVGAAGLRPSIAAAMAGKKILLANKETLVMSGDLFINAAKASRATILPIDSEHNAIFQVMPHDKYKDCGQNGIRKILLTASGGPFRNFSNEDLLTVTPSQALKHPNWVMGPKITVDSATMMNKGLEVIEARWLFDVKPDEIEVVIHPQSVIHSMVEYVDGSVLAQMGNPDMRTPIAYALGYPERLESGVASLDLFKVARLDFEKPDMKKFPCLQFAYDCLNQGGLASATLNAANEVAVEGFLNFKIGFMDIPKLIDYVLSHSPLRSVSSLDDVLLADEQARRLSYEWISKV